MKPANIPKIISFPLFFRWKPSETNEILSTYFVKTQILLNVPNNCKKREMVISGNASIPLTSFAENGIQICEIISKTIRNENHVTRNKHSFVLSFCFYARKFLFHVICFKQCIILISRSMEYWHINKCSLTLWVLKATIFVHSVCLGVHSCL